MTGRGGVWLGEVLAVCLLQGPLLVQPHALDAKHRPLHQPRPAAGGRAPLPFADPPPGETRKGKCLSRSERPRAGLCAVPHHAERCRAVGFSHRQPRGVRGQEMYARCTQQPVTSSGGQGARGELGSQRRLVFQPKVRAPGLRVRDGLVPMLCRGWLFAQRQRGAPGPARMVPSCAARGLQTSKALRQLGNHWDLLPRTNVGSGTHSQAQGRGAVQNHGCK